MSKVFDWVQTLDCLYSCTIRHNYTWKRRQRYYLTVVAVLADFKNRQDCDGSVLERCVAVSILLIPIQGVVLITLDAVQKPSKNLENCDVQFGTIQIIFMVYSEPNFFSNIFMLQIKLLFGFMRNGLLLFLFMFAWREVSLFGTQIVLWRWMLMRRPFIFYCIIYWTPCPSVREALLIFIVTNDASTQ